MFPKSGNHFLSQTIRSLFETHVFLKSGDRFLFPTIRSLFETHMFPNLGNIGGFRPHHRPDCTEYWTQSPDRFVH